MVDHIKEIFIVALAVICSAPIVPTNAHISHQSNNIILWVQRSLSSVLMGSQALLTYVCAMPVNGNWGPNPVESIPICHGI